MAFTAFACAAAPGSGQADAKITSEIARLSAAARSLESVALPEDLGKSIPGHRDLLAQAEKATSPALKLYRLREAFLGIELLSFLSANGKSGESLDALGALWSARQPDFEKGTAPARGPLVQRALVEAARNRSEKLYRASLAYAKVTSPFAGLYYLSEAEANARFAGFVESLDFGPGSDESSPSAAALQAAFDSLNEEAGALFEKDPVGRSAIPSSARLKEARELLDRNSRDGATLLLLETRLDLTRRSADPVKEPAPSRARAPRDSMGALFVSAASEESDPARAAAIRAAVIPLYESLSGGSR